MSKLRKSAKGQDCLVRLPGICSFNPETVVLAHLNGAGWALKEEDIFGAFCCHTCHDEYDRRTRKMPKDLVDLAFMQGIIRTQRWWLQNGFIKI